MVIQRKQRSWLIWLAAVMVILVVGGYWRWKFVERREQAFLGCMAHELPVDDNIRNCTNLIKLEPKNAFGYRGRGDAHRRNRDYHRALADLDTAVELDSNNPFGVLSRAEIHRELNQYREAIADFTAAINLFKTGNIPLPQSAQTSIIANAYRKRAEAYRVTGEYDHAIADLSETIARGHSWNAETRALLYLEKGDFDNAIAEYDLLIKNNPRAFSFYYHRGVAYGSKGDHDRAVADFDSAIKLAPRHASAYAKRGQAFEEKGELLKAVADYRAALSIDPSVPFARAALKRLGLE